MKLLVNLANHDEGIRHKKTTSKLQKQWNVCSDADSSFYEGQNWSGLITEPCDNATLITDNSFSVIL
jgi:hypothetical protein